MCTTCELVRRSINWSKDSLSHIRYKIGAMVSEGHLVELGMAAPSGPILIVRYKCTKCDAVWSLTYPDQAMKGGFRRE